jgi:hypothetical protein
MAGIDLGTAYITIVAASPGLGKSIAGDLAGVEAAAGVAGTKAGGKFGGGMVAAGKKFAAPLAGAFAGTAVFGLLKDSVGAASDLAESGTKIAQIFGPATADIEAFASTGAKALGQSKLDVLNAAATFGTYGKAAGKSGKDLANFSTSLTGLSTDLASFYNTDPAEAAEAIAAGLRGENEPLRKFGVLLDDATLRQKALQMGLIKTTKDALTPQQKALAAQAAIMDQTKDAQGDFAKTSGGLANQQRIMSAQFENVSASIGQKLLPVMTTIVSWINDHLLPAFNWVGKKFSEVFGWMANSGFFQAIKDAVSGLVDFLGPAFKGAFDFIKAIVGPAMDVIRGIIEVVTGIITLNWSKVWDGIKNIASGVWDAIVAAAKFAWGLIRDYIIGPLKAAWDWITGVFAGIANWIDVNIWQPIKNTTKAAWDWVYDHMIAPVKNAIQWVKDLLEGLLKWVKEMWDKIVGVFTRKVEFAPIKMEASATINAPSGSGVATLNPGGYQPIWGGQRAAGGVFNPRPGGHLIQIAEAGRQEIAAPTDLLRSVFRSEIASAGGGGRTQIGEHVTINAGVTVDEVRAAMNESLRRVPMYA